MIKIIFMLKRKPGTSREQFRQHYENSHVKLAQKYIGHLLEKYIRNYPVFASLNPSNQPAGSPPTPYDFEYDVVTEMYLKDEAAVAEMTRIFHDPAINPILVEDELRFLDRDQTLMLVIDQVDTGTAPG
jgi:uncharacterized protein (TIGR02118 family)